jgi:ribosomal protein S12 methylthiotransferase
MNKKTFHITSLGCAKNSVDSDSMAQLLIAAGYKSVDSPGNAQVLIVNTCGFINTAREESFNMLADLAAKKKSDQVLIAAGCLTERYGLEVTKQVSGINGIVGTRHWMDILLVIDNLYNSGGAQPFYHLPKVAATNHNDLGVRRVSIQGASAYIKIADGCRRPCAFCAIPLIKGTAISRPVESILSEAIFLQEKGIREIILIAQDTTDYGYDLGMKNGLAQLLREITSAVPNVDWIRIMYAYPGYVTGELIEIMSTYNQIVHYLDMPLQHAHPHILKRMNRPTNMDWVRKTLGKMRKAMPDLALRTTFIVGYPGETEEEFQTLLNFIEEIHFDKVGAFKFSFEQGTPCESLGDPIPDEVKEQRVQQLMEKQQKISLECNSAFIGRDLNVLIEGTGKGISIGRSYRDAPEIDGLVFVNGEIPSGQMIPVHITGAMAYDLSGVPLVSK